jgi:hypothetical protein
MLAQATSTDHKLIEWDVFDPVHHVGGFKDTSNEFQIANSLPDSNSALMRIDQSRKLPTRALPHLSYDNQVLVLGAQDAANLFGARRQGFVIQASRAILRRS